MAWIYRSIPAPIFAVAMLCAIGLLGYCMYYQHKTQPGHLGIYLFPMLMVSLTSAIILRLASEYSQNLLFVSVIEKVTLILGFFSIAFIGVVPFLLYKKGFTDLKKYKESIPISVLIFIMVGAVLCIFIRDWIRFS